MQVMQVHGLQDPEEERKKLYFEDGVRRIGAPISTKNCLAALECERCVRCVHRLRARVGGGAGGKGEGGEAGRKAPQDFPRAFHRSPHERTRGHREGALPPPVLRRFSFQVPTSQRRDRYVKEIERQRYKHMMQAGSGCTVHCAGRERERKVAHQVPEAAPAVGAYV